MIMKQLQAQQQAVPQLRGAAPTAPQQQRRRRRQHQQRAVVVAAASDAVAVCSPSCSTSGNSITSGSRLPRQHLQQRQHQHQRQRRSLPRVGSHVGGTHAPLAMRDVLERLIARGDLSEAEAEAAMAALLQDFSAEQAAAFLVLLRAKGETPAEVAGLARAMLAQAVRVDIPGPHAVVDIVGTGGDGIGSVNISTGACVVAAAAGARVAKHGNRSVSSLCGAADVLEALGVAIDLGPAGVARCVDEAAVGFMFAPRYHPAMAAIRPVRGALKVRTVFNVLGPLLNPAAAPYGLVGVYAPSLAPMMAEALLRLGMKRALVVHSAGLDELTPMAPADVVEVSSERGLGGMRAYTLDPKDLGVPRCEVADLAGGDAALNARILCDVFGGARGAVADALCLNAGVALAAAGVAATPAEGVAMAQEAQRAGEAGGVLARWVAISQGARRQEAAGAGAAATAATAS